MFTKLGEHIKPIIDRNKLGGGIIAARVCNAWASIVHSLLGPDFPVPETLHFKGGVLWLKASESVISQEIQLSKKQILDKYSELFREEIVQDIRFRLKSSDEYNRREIGKRV